MNSAEDLVNELAAWCASYVAAFEAYDPAAIGAHWSFPALIVSGDRSFAFEGANQFDRNTGMLMDFYRRQEVAIVRRAVEDAMALGPDTAAMRVHDEMISADGTPIVQWRSAYVLRRLPGGWRAIFADASGEAAAWTARGTPLGR